MCRASELDATRFAGRRFDGRDPPRRHEPARRAAVAAAERAGRAGRDDLYRVCRALDLGDEDGIPGAAERRAVRPEAGGGEG